MKKLLVIGALFLGIGSVSHAGILVEPYLGYESDTLKNSDGKLTGTQFGLRLAWTAPLFFWAGLDYTTGVSGKYKPDGLTESDAARSTFYAVAGVDFPILVRGWVGYGFSDQIKLGSEYSNNKYEGTSTKLGVSFTGLPFICLNLELLNEEFTKLGGTTLTDNMKNTSYVLSVSLPL